MTCNIKMTPVISPEAVKHTPGLTRMVAPGRNSRTAWRGACPKCRRTWRQAGSSGIQATISARGCAFRQAAKSVAPRTPPSMTARYISMPMTPDSGKTSSLSRRMASRYSGVSARSMRSATVSKYPAYREPGGRWIMSICQDSPWVSVNQACHSRHASSASSRLA